MATTAKNNDKKNATLVEGKNLDATLNAKNATPKGVKAESKADEPKADTPKGGKEGPARFYETRQMWDVVFNHTVTLLAKAVNGEAIAETDKEGFDFGYAEKKGKRVKVTGKEQPNIRGYFRSLLAGFSSRKALKAVRGTALENVDLYEVAERVFSGLYPDKNAKKAIGEAEPKQAKAVAIAVIASL